MRSVASCSVVVLMAAAGYASARFALTPEAAQAVAYLAIALSAWFGGVRSGIATTGLCVLTGVVVRAYPGGDSTWAGLGVLLFAGTISAVMVGRARRSH